MCFDIFKIKINHLLTKLTCNNVQTHVVLTFCFNILCYLFSPIWAPILGPDLGPDLGPELPRKVNINMGSESVPKTPGII